MKNKMVVKFDSLSENECFARNVIASFLMPLNPSIGVLSDIKTAVSEAVTNSIVHGYPEKKGEVTMSAEIDEDKIHIVVSDKGVGIENLEEALQPFFTGKPEDERSGMGFTIIKTFMDEVKVVSEPLKGTIVDMKKLITVA
ncbi:MAG: anti-sigma F factor [Clostridia bacterium]|nr:anti-sigma F factor [Clostridia bacterium]MDY2714258.1 anti-sigma F factor [Christensenellaceae bacterium]MDY3723933.1 anti-sigma F factor [Christensenellaceae bacterium]